MNTLRYIQYGLVDKWKSLLWWVVVWTFVAFVLGSLFDGLAAENNLEEVLGNLPEGLLGSLNISEGFFSQVENFASGQFLTLYILTGGLFGLFMGVGALRGKIESKYLPTVLSYQMSRVSVALAEGFVQLMFWSISAVTVGFLSWIVFSIMTAQESVSGQFFVIAMAGSFIIHIFGVCLGMFLGMIFRDPIAKSVGSALLASTWLLDGFSDTAGYPEALKPVSPFYYFDISLLQSEYALDWQLSGILIGVSATLFLVSLWKVRTIDV